MPVFARSGNHVSFVTPQPNERKTMRVGTVTGAAAANRRQPREGKSGSVRAVPAALSTVRRLGCMR